MAFVYLVDVAKVNANKPIKKLWSQRKYDTLFDLTKGHTYVDHFDSQISPVVILDAWDEYVKDAYPWLNKK